MIYRRKDDSLIKLPPKVDRTINLRLTGQESAFYDYVRQHMPFKSMWAKLIRLRQGIWQFDLHVELDSLFLV